MDQNNANHLENIFFAALDIHDLEARASYLNETCGQDAELRQRVEQMLAIQSKVGSFMENPPVSFAGTIDLDKKILDAGLTAGLREDHAVVIGSANHSVLKSLSRTLNEMPRVMLRDPKEVGIDPIIRPRSKEIPADPSDSRYRLDGEIARGGMGAIIKGRAIDLGRDLAIKVLLDSHKDKPEVVQRFIEEAQIGGQLQHPGIVPVYELGQFGDQRPFFSMKLVKGQTLAQVLGARKHPSEDRAKYLGIFEQICQTMAYAHSRGVIHRDLKPANIMVGAFGEVQVMDWGLAKVLAVGGIADEKKSLEKQTEVSIIRTLRSVGSDSPGSLGSMTQMGSVMGTPAYMSPEQALGEVDRLDERTDVFGLGAILCEILTGKPPYVGASGEHVFRMASRGKLEDCYARLEATINDPELLQIVRDALSLEPDDRLRDGRPGGAFFQIPRVGREPVASSGNRSGHRDCASRGSLENSSAGVGVA
jgi:tRNA A-37 threonylcarbamoyl transferase component Bud32